MCVYIYIYTQHFRRGGEHIKSDISTISLLDRLSVPAVVSVPVLGTQATLSIFSFIGFLYLSYLLRKVR